MIKKILLLLFLLFFCTLFIIYYLIDKIYINNYIKNLEETLKINIYLEEPHQFIVIPHIAFLANFNLDNKEKKIFLKGGEFNIKKNYNRKKAIFNFNSDNIKIDKFIFDNLVTSGEINEYDFNNLLKFTIFAEGNLLYNINTEEKNSLKFVNLIIQRLNIPEAYKKLSDLSFHYLNDKSFFTSKIFFDKGLILIDYFESKQKDYLITLNGEYNLEKELVDLKVNIKIKDKNTFDIKIIGNLDNPNIKILSTDKTVDFNFNINDFNQILDGNIENILKNVITNE